MLVLFLLVTFLGSESTLLCFGKDGHVAVEFVDACSGAALESQLGAVESDACGPCEDVQILSDFVYTRNVSHCTYTQTIPFSSLPPMSPALPAYEISVTHIDPPVYSHQNKTLASLQSVVLLI